MKKLIFAVLTIILIVTIPACDELINNDESGRLVVKVTDDPFPVSNVESATVTITKVEVRRAGDGVPDGKPFMLVSEDTLTFDLLELRNGVVEEMLDFELPQGKYDLVRLYVYEASLKIKDGGTYNVKVPSGQQTGIKIFIRPGITVEGGLTSELLLDFDLSRSFIMTGNNHKPSGINGFIFKPVIRAVNLSTSGRIEGLVTDTAEVNLPNTQVWVAQDTIVSTAYTNDSGYYAFIGIPAGTYSLYATKENYDTVSYADINVIAGNKTIQNFMLTLK
ncbi:MAG: DUF4382 domain-containing protein [Bacteroidia bacterium]|nr:DUF4382 domain-containing protein [Bacteroidia bacterium]